MDLTLTMPAAAVPALFAHDDRAARRTLEFYTAHIRSPNTRRAYARAGADFARWCAERGVMQLVDVQPIHVATYIEQLPMAAPSVKQRLAALRQLFDWLVTGQVIATNPAAAVRGPKHSVRTGQTPVLAAEEARELIDAIDCDTAIGLRDRALIGLMLYTFARVGAAVRMQVGDIYTQRRRTWVRLHEKGGKLHDMPCHHNLEEYLHAYMDELGDDGRSGYVFRTAIGPTGRLSQRPMRQADVHRMIARRAAAAGIGTHIGCHSFRATGITEYLKNGGKLEIAQQMANHESTRTTSMYDRRGDMVKLDEVERILV